MKTEVIKIDVKRIGKVLKSINTAERIYLEHCIDISNALKELIKKYNLTKEFVCQRFKVTPKRYTDFIIGNYEYSLMDMARLNEAVMELETERIHEKLPVKVSAKHLIATAHRGTGKSSSNSKKNN